MKKCLLDLLISIEDMPQAQEDFEKRVPDALVFKILNVMILGVNVAFLYVVNLLKHEKSFPLCLPDPPGKAAELSL